MGGIREAQALLKGESVWHGLFFHFTLDHIHGG